MTTRPRHLSGGAASMKAGLRTALTEVELVWIEGRCERWIRFGRVAAEQTVDGDKRIVGFRPGATFAFVRCLSNGFGALHSSIQIVTAVAADEPCTTLPFVRPGGELLLRISGWPKVSQVLRAIDAVEAAGVDPCDASPNHWRHVDHRVEAGLAFRPYGGDRHAAWLRRRAVEQ